MNLEKNLTNFTNNLTGNQKYENGFSAKFVYLFVVSLASVCCIIFTCTNVTVFSNQQFKEKLFAYLKLESIFITLDLIIMAVFPMYDFTASDVSRSLFACVYHKYGKIYLASILEMSAIISSIFASINCLVLIDSQSNNYLFKLANSFNPYLVALLEIVFSAVIFLYQLFQHDIVEKEMGKYFDAPTDFSRTQLSYILELSTFILRDVVLVIVLILINVLMVIEVKKSLNKKLEITSINGNNNYKSTSIKRSQRKLTKMVITDSLIGFFSRLTTVIYFLLKDVHDQYLLKLFLYTVFLIITLSYGAKFFIYYYFNRRFRNFFKKEFYLFLVFFHLSKNNTTPSDVTHSLTWTH
jgi:hypothetical protein